MRENYQHELFIETKENTLANSLLMCFIGRLLLIKRRLLSVSCGQQYTRNKRY